MDAAVVTAGVLHGFLPDDFRATPRQFFLYPTFLLAFLGVLIVGDPGRIDQQRRWLRVTTELMIGLITVINAAAATRLVVGILTTAKFSSPAQLLTIAGVIWLTNVIAFALWFWDLDAGGAAARQAGATEVPVAFVFPEMTLPELVPVGWFPQFVDYLALSFNTAMAFSPTDVIAIRRWAKLLMIVESLISLLIGLLAVARAVNVL
ncbi:MAG: hypothetical protein ACXV2H_13325 [Actinomycetes bacterium]